MKNKSLKISANEINRFIYCPYQWYYGRYYGQTTLKEKYKALGTDSSKHQSHFEKGIKFHRGYYRSYRIKRLLQFIAAIFILGIVIWSINQWLR